jgi:hypothetical protein
LPEASFFNRPARHKEADSNRASPGRQQTRRGDQQVYRFLQ